MADNREIKGLRVPYLDSDYPSAVASTQEGQVWYNSSTGKLRAFIAFDTVATSSELINNRAKHASAGIQTAAMIFGGLAGPSMNLAGGQSSEEYNGSGFASAPDLANDRQMLGGCGTTTATLGAAGYPVGDNGTHTEEYNGTAWSETANLGTARYGPGVTGTQTAALCITGNAYPNPLKTEVEQYDGSSWTEIADVNTARRVGGASGTTTSALHFGGAEPSQSAKTESWDGSSWTEVGDLNTARSPYGAGDGTSTAARNYQGYSTAAATVVESWDGSSWTETTDTPTAHWGNSGCGTFASAIIAGGYKPPGNTADAEAYEYNHAIITYTPEAWSSITNTPASGSNGFIGNCGTTTAGLFLTYGPPSQHTIEWDGSSWTAGGNYPSDRFGGAKGGTQTAAFAAGGTPPVTTEGNTYDGSTWTDAGTMSQGRNYFGGGGTQTAGIICGGWLGPPGRTVNTDEFDGSSWTAGGNLNNGTWRNGIAGTSTAGMTTGLNNPSGTSDDSLDAETYNGTAWTNNPGVLVSAIAYFGNMAGPSTNWLAYGTSTSKTTSYIYDGTSTITSASINTARTTGQGFGISTSAILATGYDGTSPGLSNAGEEFSSATSAAEAVDVDFD